MTSKGILQSLKDSLESNTGLEFTDVSMKIESSEKMAKGTIAKFVDGKWFLFEVFVRPLGVSETIEIGA